MSRYGKDKGILFDICQDMLLKGMEIVKGLKMFIKFIEVNLKVFMSEDVAQPCHWQYAVGKFRRDNAFPANCQYCFFIIFRPWPIVIYDDMVTYV